MLNALVPFNESSRLAAVRETCLVGTEAEACFDRFTRLAAHLFQVPIALISLVDESRIWHKSRYGFGPRQTPRDTSFCAHAINEDGVFLVEDAALDERFCDNPLVTGDPAVRFYAGYPLLSPHGYKLGTLCAIDPRPRQFSERAGEALKDIAEMVSAEIVSQQFSAVDPMTGLPNLRGFTDIAEHALAMCTRSSAGAAVVMLELEGVDIFEDQCLDMSDARALQAFGHQIRLCVRASDVAARLVDNKFVVLLTHATMEQAWQWVDRFRSLVAEQQDQDAGSKSPGFCAGVAVYDPARHATIDQLLEEGQQMLYRQKRARPRRGLAVKSG